MLPQSTYHSKEYRDFRAIEPGDWRGVVRFYEKNEAAIRGLDFEEYFELLLAYTDALSEIGAWQKHLLMADVVIEISVMENLPASACHRCSAIRCCQMCRPSPNRVCPVTIPCCGSAC